MPFIELHQRKDGHMSSEFSMSIEKATKIADRFLKLINPCCLKVSICGSIRRTCPIVHDIEFVAVPNDEFCFGRLFMEGYPGLVVNGTRLKRFKYPESGIQIELYLPQPHDYGRILAIRTGSSAYARLQLMTQANRLGWIGTHDGLRRKKECEKRGEVWKILPEHKLNPMKPPEFPTEESFFEFLQIPWVIPKERSWLTQKIGYDYSK